MITSEKANLEKYIDGLLTKAVTELGEQVVKLREPKSKEDYLILTYLIKEEEFELIPKSTIGQQFKPEENLLNLNLIPLFLVLNQNINGQHKVEMIDAKEKEIKILSQETKQEIIKQMKQAMLLDDTTKTESSVFGAEKYLGFDFKSSLTRESNLFKSFTKDLSRYCHNKGKREKICGLFNHKDTYHTTLLNLLKEEILENGIGIEIGDITSYCSLELVFSKDESNNIFLSQLFEENIVSQLIENYYQEIKSDKSSIERFYGVISDLSIWDEYYSEIKNLYKNKDGKFYVHQYTVMTSFKKLLINNLLKEKEQLVISSSEFQEVIPYLELLEEHKNLTVSVTADEFFDEKEKYFLPKRINYFYQEVRNSNFYCPVLLTEGEQKEMVENYQLYKDNPQFEIAEPWKDILDLLVSYHEFLKVEFDTPFCPEADLEESFHVSCSEARWCEMPY